VEVEKGEMCEEQGGRAGPCGPMGKRRASLSGFGPGRAHRSEGAGHARLGFGWWRRDTGGDVINCDAELAMRWDVELREVCCHGAACCCYQVAVASVPGAGVIVRKVTVRP
jgi:hypothetical protein